MLSIDELHEECRIISNKIAALERKLSNTSLTLTGFQNKKLMIEHDRLTEKLESITVKLSSLDHLDIQQA